MDEIQETAVTSTDVDAATDTRPISENLVGKGARTVLESLKHVLPAEGAGRVPVAAFGSSI